jgi:hypothetical protein
MDDVGEETQQTINLLASIASWFHLTPEFVIGAHNQLTSSPYLRRFFGTTIDFKIIVDELKNAFTLNLTLGKPLSDYYKIGPSNLEIASPLPDGLPILLASPTSPNLPDQNSGPYTDYFKNSIMVLNGHVRAFSCDPQAAAKAADEAQEFVASLPDDVRKPAPGARWLLQDRVAKVNALLGNSMVEPDAAQLSASLADVVDNGKRLAAMVRINNQISNLPTIGQSLYLPNYRWIPPTKVDSFCEHEMTRGFVVYVRRKKGNAIPTDWVSLTRVFEEVAWRTAKHPASDTFLKNGHEEEQGIQVGGGVHSTDDKGVTRLDDGFVCNWTGPGLSTRNSMIHQESEGVQSGQQELANEVAAVRKSVECTSPEDVAMLIRNRKLFDVQWFPFHQRQEGPDLLARRTFVSTRSENVYLAFGHCYDYLVSAQYHNGYVPIKAQNLNQHSNPAQSLADGISSGWITFERQDHIKDVLIALENNIYQDAEQKTLKPQFPGESPADLVVRTGELLSNDACSRLILPPPIPTFQLYLWYDHEDLLKMAKTGRDMSLKDLAHWYKRYSCNAGTANDFASKKSLAKQRNEIVPGSGCETSGCKAGCSHFCGGIRQPTVWADELRYLPDPVVTGFVVECFLDKDCLLPAPADKFPPQFCPYAVGRYPDLKPWRLVLHRLKWPKGHGNRIKKDKDDCELHVNLAEGEQIYLRIIAAYDKESAHFAKPLIDDPAIPFRAYSETADQNGLFFDPRLANAKVLSLTHAVQRPLFDPVIQHIVVNRYNDKLPGPNSLPANQLRLTLNLHFEHLDMPHFGVPIPDTARTGELELFALWNDYGESSLAPTKSIEEKRDNSSPSGGFVRIARLTFEKNVVQTGRVEMSADNDAWKYWSQVVFSTDAGTFSATHFTDAVFKVRNGSKFHRFFHLGPTPEDALETHVRWSNEFRLSDNPPRILQADSHKVSSLFLPNNHKPESPRIRKIVPLLVDDRDCHGLERTVRGNRVRIYLEPEGRMRSGKDERIGVVVHEEIGIYTNQMTGFRSKAGRDIVTDLSADKSIPSLKNDELSITEFELDGARLEADYLKQFKPEYDRYIFGNVGVLGLVSYVPQFDPKQGLWYFDPEFKICNLDNQEFHNVFVQLGLISYQPWSANYNDQFLDTSVGFEQDLRFSQPILADFFGLYPTRNFKNPCLLFGTHDRSRFALCGSISSLLFREKTDRSRSLGTQFVLVVEEVQPGGFYKKLKSRLKRLDFILNNTVLVSESDFHADDDELSTYHCLLPVDLPELVRKNEYTNSTFECELSLDFDPGFLRSRSGGHFQVVIYEIEWFSDAPISTLFGRLKSAELAQIPGVRIKNPTIFR